MAADPLAKRKQFLIAPDVLRALDQLARDGGKQADLLIDEALRDLFKKYHRPLTIKEALRTSVRNLPDNDPAPSGARSKRARGKV